MAIEHGQFYAEVFEARQRGDCIELVSFERHEVEDWLKRARQFVSGITELIKLMDK